jgi:hypothetical protein
MISRLAAVPTGATEDRHRALPSGVGRLPPLSNGLGERPGPVVTLCLDAWLLATHTGRGASHLPNGREWEREVSGLLATTGCVRRQGPGGTTLLGLTARTGVRHELDAVGRWRTGAGGERPHGTVVIEAKASAELPKSEAITFAAKVFDFYLNQLPSAAGTSWYPILVSAGAVSDAVRRTCAERAVTLIEPVRLPLPVLLWMAARPGADARLRPQLLAECVRLAPRACATVQERWTLLGDGRVAYDPRWWNATALRDLCYVQDELSGDVLDLYDRYKPGALERRAAMLTAELSRTGSP